MHQALVLVLFTIPLGACGFVHDERIDGPYRLVAIDVSEEMAICYEIENGCIGRIPETVYAVGFDTKYLVAARHPNAASLFTLWSTSEEASQLFQEHASHPNIYLGTGRISNGELSELQKRRIDPITWFDSPKNLSAFLWYETAEGKSYGQALDRAQREGK